MAGVPQPADNKPRTWLKSARELQGWSLRTRLKIPLIYGIDAVHGHNNVLGAVIFPQQHRPRRHPHLARWWKKLRAPSPRKSRVRGFAGLFHLASQFLKMIAGAEHMRALRSAGFGFRHERRSGARITGG